jgi:hypothetical protein
MNLGRKVPSFECAAQVLAHRPPVVPLIPNLPCLGARGQACNRTAEIADGRVPSPRIVETFDVIEHIGLSVVPCMVDFAGSAFGF